jgi:hypothetical protein
MPIKGSLVKLSPFILAIRFLDFDALQQNSSLLYETCKSGKDRLLNMLSLNARYELYRTLSTCQYRRSSKEYTRIPTSHVKPLLDVTSNIRLKYTFNKWSLQLVLITGWNGQLKKRYACGEYIVNPGELFSFVNLARWKPACKNTRYHVSMLCR